MKSSCAGPPDAPLQWPGSRDSGLSALSPQQSVHRATQCDALSRVTRPRHEYVTSPAAGDTNLCRTQHPEYALHKWYLWWRGNIISILGGREFLRHCKRAGVETICRRLAAFSNGFSLVCAVWTEGRSGLGYTRGYGVWNSEKIACRGSLWIKPIIILYSVTHSL